MFVNGIARWDFDSVLQTSDALRADAQLQSIIPASVIPALHKAVDSNQLIAKFNYPAPIDGMDGVSVLVNDVERSREFYERLGSSPTRAFEWERPTDMVENEYIRWAYIKDGKTLDYSKPGVLSRDGKWSPPDEVVS